MESDRISDKLNRKKELPIKELCKSVRMSRDRIEDMKDYIVAYYLILRNPEYKVLQDSLKIKLKEKSFEELLYKLREELSAEEFEKILNIYKAFGGVE